MATLFDEKKLKKALSNMQETEREQYVNGFLDLVGPNFLKKGNNNLSTAINHLGIAITFAKTEKLSSNLNIEIQNYLLKIGV